MNLSSAQQPKQVIWLPRPQIKLAWFNFRFGLLLQPYIKGDIFHYTAKPESGEAEVAHSLHRKTSWKHYGIYSIRLQVRPERWQLWCQSLGLLSTGQRCNTQQPACAARSGSRDPKVTKSWLHQILFWGLNAPSAVVNYVAYTDEWNELTTRPLNQNICFITIPLNSFVLPSRWASHPTPMTTKWVWSQSAPSVTTTTSSSRFRPPFPTIEPRLSN